MTRQDIIKMVKEIWGEDSLRALDSSLVYLEAFATLVAEAEREACAKVLDAMAENDKLSNYYRVAALAIRERGAP